jgi:hypothetical protein
MQREFRLVGLLAAQDCNGDSNDIRRDVPYMTWSDSVRQDFEYANTYQVVFDGDVDNDNCTETVRYYRDATSRTLKQQVWQWSRDSIKWRGPTTQNIATDVDYVLFTYLDRDGNTIPNPVTYPTGGYTLTAGERVRVTAVQITLLVRAQHRDDGRNVTLCMPDGTTFNDKYRRTEETFLVRGRNLSLGA